MLGIHELRHGTSNAWNSLAGFAQVCADQREKQAACSDVNPAGG
jgi:hypothetical protein